MLSRVPHRILDFLNEQVPNIVPQSRSELEFSAVWLLVELLPDLKTTDFKYIPQGPKGPSSPLLDPSSIVSPSASKMQNYIVARSRDIRHTPEQVIHKEITLNGVLRSHKNAKAMLMFSHVHPSEHGALMICHMQIILKLPVTVVFSLPRKDMAIARKILSNYGIEVIQIPPRLPITLPKSKLKDIKVIPNIEHLFHGYDLLYGNPIVDTKEGHDPGVSRLPIFKPTFDRGLTTSDQKYLIPDGMSFLKTVSCKIEFTSSENRNEMSYIADLITNNVLPEVEFLKVAFKASTTVQHKVLELKKASYSYLNTKAACSVYTGTISKDLPPKLSDELRASLKKCDKDPSDENLRILVSKFGTHFLTDVVMGSKFGEESKVATDEYEKMVSEGLDVGAAAGLSGRLSAGITTETSSEKQQRERFESARTSKTTLKHGSDIPPDGDASTWIAKSLDDPVPINAEMKVLTELVTNEFLGDTDIDLKRLKQRLTDFLTKYCSKLVMEGKVKDCMLPTEFANNGPGLKKVITQDTPVIGIDMLDQDTIALVHGDETKGFKLAIHKHSEELASKTLTDKDLVLDLVVCHGSRRLGVLITDASSFGRIEVHEVSDDGRIITKREEIDLLRSGLKKNDLGHLFTNSLSHYDEANGMLLVKQGAKSELLKIENICLPGAHVTVKRILNMENLNYTIQSAVHLSNNLFALSLHSPILNDVVKVVEVLSEMTYNDNIATVTVSGSLFANDMIKDDRDILVVLGTQLGHGGVDNGRMTALRFLKGQKKLMFGAHLLTEEILPEGSELGVVTVHGNKVIFGEQGLSDTGKVMEYKYRYE